MLAFATSPYPAHLFMKKPKADIYKGKPWNSPAEYFELSLRYGLFGLELERAVKKDMKSKKIPLPSIYPPKKTRLADGIGSSVSYER